MEKTEIEKRQLTKAEIRSGKVSREEFRKLKRNPIYLLLDSVKSTHNVGTIIRLADAIMVEKVFICGDAALPPSKKVRKGSLGSENWVDWEHREDAVDALSELKEKGISIVIRIRLGGKLAVEVERGFDPYTLRTVVETLSGLSR